MITPDPLDRPIWPALAEFAPAYVIGEGCARRFVPDLHVFAAAVDETDASLCALATLADHGPIALVEANPPALLPGLVRTRHEPIYQLVLERPSLDSETMAAVDLTDADAGEMLDLARTTEPGPFFPLTHRMGHFVGVRDPAGRLIAMAGERLRFAGHVELSAVCTHPDYRGRGIARHLMQIVMRRNLAQDVRLFLHAFPGNSAIPLYERLGFRIRRVQLLSFFERPSG